MSDVPAIADETMTVKRDSLLDQVEYVVCARGSSAGAAAVNRRMRAWRTGEPFDEWDERNGVGDAGGY